MTTTAKAADNGSTTTDKTEQTEKPVPAQREHGLDRLCPSGN